MAVLCMHRTQPFLQGACAATIPAASICSNSQVRIGGQGWFLASDASNMQGDDYGALVLSSGPKKAFAHSVAVGPGHVWPAQWSWLSHEDRSTGRSPCSLPAHRSSSKAGDPIERGWTRVLREAGARVAPKQLLRDTNVPLANPDDQRQLDLVAYGLAPDGVALCCDATMVSPLQRDSRPISHAANVDGAALAAAERRKRAHYVELDHSPYCRLMVLGCEVGGRWSDDSLRLVSMASRQKVLGVPRLLRSSARQAWCARWWGMLSVCAQVALASTLLGTAPGMRSMAQGEEVTLTDAWHHLHGTSSDSRLPLRGL